MEYITCCFVGKNEHIYEIYLPILGNLFLILSCDLKKYAKKRVRYNSNTRLLDEIDMDAAVRILMNKLLTIHYFCPHRTSKI